jgi:uncharacterized membrane protein YphA (DoxX/SURF4 family)
VLRDVPESVAGPGQAVVRVEAAGVNFTYSFRFHLSPPAPYAVATILVQLLGSAMLIVGPYKWLGAIALSSFTALTIPVAHDFWNQVSSDRETSLDFAIEHMAVIGGLLVAARLAVASRCPGAE